MKGSTTKQIDGRKEFIKRLIEQYDYTKLEAMRRKSKNLNHKYLRG